MLATKSPVLIAGDDDQALYAFKNPSRATLTVDDEATTTLRLHVVADFSETVRAGAEKGWASQLDKLAELLAAA